MSHEVRVALPDGRIAVADYRDPIVVIMRRILRRIGDPDHRRGRVPGSPADLADKVAVAEWLDAQPITTTKEHQSEQQL